jgi:(p)ppGpp synthase/HD superfamily hydrolase
MSHVLGKALALAADIHRGHLYGDSPYLFHLLQVLKTVQEQGESLEVQVLAVFHDSLEDHPEEAGRVFAFLAEHGLDIGESLKAITRDYYGRESYDAFIDRVILDEAATIVKLADLQRNAAPKKNRSEHHIKRALEVYIPAMAKITKALLARHKGRN